MRKAAVASIIFACSLTTPSFAQEAQPPTTEKIVVEGVGAVEAVRVTASIEAVDLANRIVTLKGPRGNTHAVTVSDRVKNLPQVKVGDMLEIDYFESVALTLEKSEGMSARTVSEDVVTAKPGEKPGAIALRKVTTVTDVQSIDTVHQAVTVRGPLGHLARVKVKDPAMLEGVKAGDQVTLTYIEGRAIFVRPGKGK